MSYVRNITYGLKNRFGVGVFTLLVCMWLVSCIADEYEAEPTVVRTLLFYMGGDNNLSSEVSQRMEQLQTAVIPPGNRVLIYENRRGENSKLWELESGKTSNKLTLVYEEKNTVIDTSTKTLAKTFSVLFRKVGKYYPAPSYGLVVFSHASGWMPEGTYNDSSLRSVITDGQSEMELSDFAAAIPDGMFDFVVFETCHMAGIEVAWELKNKTKHLVASSAEIVSPGFTPLWAELLPLLLKAEPDLEGFIQKIQTDYLSRPADYASLTLSVIDTKALDALADILIHSSAIKARIDTIYTNGFLCSDIDKTSIQSFDRNNQHLFFDLEDYINAVGPEEEVAVLSQAIRHAVPYKVSTATFMPNYGGFNIVSHSGLTTYIPQQQYPRLNEAYKQLKWYKEVLSSKEK